MDCAIDAQWLSKGRMARDLAKWDGALARRKMAGIQERTRGSWRVSSASISTLPSASKRRRSCESEQEHSQASWCGPSVGNDCQSVLSNGLC